MRLGWVAVLFVLGACRPSGVADVLLGEVPDFGDVPLGARRVVQLDVENAGAAAATLELSATEPFFVEPSTRELAPRTRASLGIGLHATSLGPQTGELRMRVGGVEITRPLRASVTGAAIDVVSSYAFPSSYALTLGAPEISTASLTIRNVGTDGSLLTLGTPRVEGSDELCAGSFVNGTCRPWAPEPLLGTNDTRSLPLEVRPTGAGPQAWSVVLPSSDPLRPEVRVAVSAEPKAIQTCDLDGPGYVRIGAVPQRLSYSHRGTAPCLVRSIDFLYGSVFSLDEGPALPLELAPGEGFSVLVSALAAAPNDARDDLVVQSAGDGRFSFPLFRDLTYCLSITPSPVDLGAVGVHCSTRATVEIRNGCSQPLPLSQVWLSSHSGEQPGTALCPGFSPCPEFRVDAVPAGERLAPDAGRWVSIEYRPLSAGSDTGTLGVKVGMAVIDVPLLGRGELDAEQVDTWLVEPLTRIDLLAMVDSSPSFTTRRASVRDNLAALLGRFDPRCYDLRFGVAAADGAPDAGVHLLPNDAGEPWSSSQSPDFIARAMSAFDALPVGSEVEACVGPAANVITDAGVRPGAALAGLCVTDALEQSVDPRAALARFRAAAGGGYPTWNAVVGAYQDCGVEALDDGGHRSLVDATLGNYEDVCSPGWYQGLSPFAVCTPPSRRFLSRRPAGAIEIGIDGVLVDPSRWTYEATGNSFTFVAGSEPVPGQTVTARYVMACTP